MYTKPLPQLVGGIIAICIVKTYPNLSLIILVKLNGTTWILTSK
jgi:hypothetical protein